MTVAVRTEPRGACPRASDTIHRAAARLRPALEGRPVVRLRVPRWSGALPEPGETVDAAGKPYFTCGERIARIVQGRELPRSTYWCPACQSRA